MEVLFRDMEIHYTALDRLSGWILVQKYHSQLLRQGESSNVTEELLKVCCYTQFCKSMLFFRVKRVVVCRTKQLTLSHLERRK